MVDTCADAQVKLNDSGAVVVDEAMQTSVDNIYAIGDVIGPTSPLPSKQLFTSPHPCCPSLLRVCSNLQRAPWTAEACPTQLSAPRSPLVSSLSAPLGRLHGLQTASRSLRSPWRRGTASPTRSLEESRARSTTQMSPQVPGYKGHGGEEGGERAGYKGHWREEWGERRLE